MKVISVKEACQILEVTDKTLRNWIDDDILDRHEDEKGNLVLDKRQVLELKSTTICVFNQKGGVSKTDSILVMMDYFEYLFMKRNESRENRKKKILIIDLDPQASLSQAMFADRLLYGDIIDDDIDFEEDLAKEEKRRKRETGFLTLYDFFFFGEPLQNIVRKYNDYIDLLPGDILMNPKNNMDFLELPKYKKEIYNFIKKNKYSLVFIDTHPDTNSYSRLGILLANFILCPLLPTDNVFRSLKGAMRTIIEMIPHNPDYIDHKCFISANKGNKTRIRDWIKKKYKKHLSPKNKLFEKSIPDFVGIVERETEKENLFIRYGSEPKTIEPIIEFMKELESIIYN